jgi:hypothetical protein
MSIPVAQIIIFMYYENLLGLTDKELFYCVKFIKFFEEFMFLFIPNREDSSVFYAR